jgi:serine/threonine protein phosphatase PrpC
MTMEPPVVKAFLNRDMDALEVYSFCGGTAAVFSRRSPMSEGENQDAAALIPIDGTRGVIAVADGVGGARGGAQASATAILELSAALEEVVPRGLVLREAILDGIESANREVCALQIGAATTLAVAEIQGTAMRPYHVGDSQILLLGRGGKRKLFTVPHSPLGYAQDGGLMSEREAMVHEARHIVSNVIGLPWFHVDMGSALELSAKDTLLVACDGLFDNLSSDDVIETLRTGTLEESVGRLVERCLERMNRPREGRPSKPDDLTLIAFRVDPSADEE